MLQKHWCRFGARNDHSLKEAANGILICYQTEAIVKTSNEMDAIFAQKEAKNVATKPRQNGMALAAQPNDMAHNLRGCGLETS